MPRAILHPNSASPVLTKVASIRFDPEEYARLQSLSDERHISFSALVRRVVLSYSLPPQRTPKLDADVVRELNRIGTNLNQVSHNFNRWRAIEGDATQVEWAKWELVVTYLNEQLKNIREVLT